ncbi:MAG: preprotein translocase subunit SecF [bacterium ADurb.Bin400]|nr:MAG: preprotein translocase subunit SecF [bacterium ADurb.Bin400]
MYKIIRNSKYWYIFSSLLAVLSIVSLVAFGLRVGIDYRGGTVMEIKSNSTDRVKVINESLNANNFTNYQIKEGGDNRIILRLPAITAEQHTTLLSAFKSKLPDITETKYDTVGPTIGKDLTKKSVIAVILASIGIILYIAYAFRRMPKPLSSWLFGFAAVVALVHDLLITAGIVSLLGHFFHWMEVDVLFITALLTIMGFSVHDTIVIYDRLRENFIRNPHKEISQSAEESINQTLVRSINTSLTLILALLAMIILGSESIRHFIVTLTVGVTIGTYSSILVSAPLVVSWHKDTQSNKLRKAS